VFTFLPFQTSDHGFAVAYYTMTRDITSPAAEQAVEVALGDISAPAAHARVFDPLDDRWLPVPVVSAGDRLVLRLPTASHPRLLLIEDHPASRRENSTKGPS
jgi:hypothetical protein